MLDPRRIEKHISLAPYTTYRIGGPADLFVTVHSQDELKDAVLYARRCKIPYFILGTGANILIGDKGFRGIVILNQARAFHFERHKLVSESGTPISKLITASQAKSLSGLEHFVGIPSSVGGALRQNLHFLSPDRKSTAFISELFVSSVILDSDNNTKVVDKTFFKFGYDDSILHHANIVVLEASFQLKPSNRSTINHRIAENLAWRKSKQPQLEDYPSCGSVFKKIEGVGAGRLIERANLKGRCFGGAMISELHANYILNLGQASAKDIRDAIASIQQEVLAKTGYHLEPEISFAGEF